MDSYDNELTVEVFVRPQQLMEPIDSKIDTLHQFDAVGHIDNLSVHGWPETITLSERTPYSSAIDEFERMESWADEHEVSIRPPFSVRTTTSTFTEETQTKLRTPVMCLAIYVGERLANVFPHSQNDTQYSVADGIAALKTDELDLFPVPCNLSESPPDRCPVCRDWLMNVQGIGVCQDCDRIELDTTQFSERSQRSRITHEI